MQRGTYWISSRWWRRGQKRGRSKVKRRRNPVKIRRSRESRRRAGALRRRRRPWKPLVRRRKKLPVRSKKNICIIKFPKRGYRMNCPLMSWCFDRWIRGSRIPFQVAKPRPPCKKSGPCLRMPFRARRKPKKKTRHARLRRCPDFLRAALREMAKKEGAKRPASANRKQRHYSDDEIFYKLANSLSRGREDKADRRSEGVALKVSQPTGES